MCFVLTVNGYCHLTLYEDTILFFVQFLYPFNKFLVYLLTSSLHKTTPLVYSRIFVFSSVCSKGIIRDKVQQRTMSGRNGRICDYFICHFTSIKLNINYNGRIFKN